MQPSIPPRIAVFSKGARPATEDYVLAAAAGYATDYRLLPPADMCRDSRGKPYFPGRRDFFLSVSHSGEYVAVALYTQPVGVDIQQHRRCRFSAISERFYHPLEQAEVKKGGERAFFDIWVKKESYVKYTGEGIGGGFSSFSSTEALPGVILYSLWANTPPIGASRITREACPGEYLAACGGEIYSLWANTPPIGASRITCEACPSEYPAACGGEMNSLPFREGYSLALAACSEISPEIVIYG